MQIIRLQTWVRMRIRVLLEQKTTTTTKRNNIRRHIHIPPNCRRPFKFYFFLRRQQQQQQQVEKEPKRKAMAMLWGHHQWGLSKSELGTANWDWGAEWSLGGMSRALEALCLSVAARLHLSGRVGYGMVQYDTRYDISVCERWCREEEEVAEKWDIRDEQRVQPERGQEEAQVVRQQTAESLQEGV